MANMINISQQTANDVQDYSSMLYKAFDLLNNGNGNGTGTVLENIATVLNVLDLGVGVAQSLKVGGAGLTAASYITNVAALDVSMADVALKSSAYSKNPSLENTNALIQSLAGVTTSFGGVITAIGTGAENPYMVGVGLGFQGIGMVVKEANKNYDVIPASYWEPVFRIIDDLNQSIATPVSNYPPLQIEIIGSGGSPEAITIDASNGELTTKTSKLNAFGAVVGEQLATYSASRNLTQVINLANSSVIGCAVIDGQATLSQLAQESDLAVQMGVASSLTSSGVVDLFTSMGLSSSTSVIQALQTADQSYTGSNIAAAPVINSAADLNSYVTGKATDGSSTFVESVARIWATATDIVADPRALALEDGPLAIRLAQQNPSTLNVLVALQKIAIAGAVMSPEYFKATANQLGTTPDDLYNLVSRGGTALTSIIAAYQNPTPTSVAQAAIQLLQANLPEVAANDPAWQRAVCGSAF